MKPLTSKLAIIGAGVAGCSLATRLCQQGWEATDLSIWEAGRGAGGRTATRRSRQDPNLRIDHGANVFNIGLEPPPLLLEPLLQQGWVESWTDPVALMNGEGVLLPEVTETPLLKGSCFRGSGGMDQLCRGLLALTDERVPATFDTLVRGIGRENDCWVLTDLGGQPLVEARAIVLTGTLLAHPRSRLTFGWPSPPLQTLAEQLQDPGLNHSLAAIAALRFEARSSLLLRLPAQESGRWKDLPFRLLAFDASAQQRWGLWRVSIQSLPDGSIAVVAHSSATFAGEHLQIYGSGSAMARQLGLAPQPEQEQHVMGALSQALDDVLTPWMEAGATGGGERQLMRWGAAFPVAPGLPPELCWNSDLRLGFCGDFLAGPGFGRVEGAMRSAEFLAQQIGGPQP